MFRAFFLYGVLFTFCTSVLSADEIEIRFATLAPKSSAWGKFLSKTTAQLFNETDKQVKLKVFYGGAQGDESEMVDKINFNQLEGGAFTGNGLGKICIESRVLEIPGMFKNGAEVDYVYERMEDDLNKYFIKKGKGFYLISLSETGFAYFFSKKDIKCMEDIRKTKMWIWKGDKLVLEFMNQFNIPAVPVNFTEVVSSLQTGLIDGFYVTPTAAVSLQWNNEIKTMLDMPITSVTGGLVISLESWNKLSPKQKATFKSVAKRNVKELMVANRQADLDTINLLKQNGVKINRSTDAPDLMEKTGKNLEAKLGDMVPAELLKKVRALVLEARKQ
jgi:TRAP-type C4-dicarboxylate transport system substrate-binding protein